MKKYAFFIAIGLICYSCSESDSLELSMVRPSLDNDYLPIGNYHIDIQKELVYRYVDYNEES